MADPEPYRRRLSLARAWQSLIRLPFVLGRLMLDLLPVLAFLGIAMMLLGTEIGDMPTTRLVILAVVNAYALSRGLICAVRALAGPFGLFCVRAETAAYIEIWARRIVSVAVSGIAFANVALLLGLHRGGYAALLRLVMLVVHLFVVVIILQCRRQVADLIRAPTGREGLAARARDRLASLWHYLAITVDIALWAVWAMNIRNGYSLLLQYFIGTVAVVGITRLLTIVVLSVIDRGFSVRPDILQRFPGLETRANRYLPLLRRIVATIIAFIGFVAVLEIWGVDAIVWFYGGQIGSRLLSALATVAIAALVAAAIWEASNALMDRQINALSRDGHYARAARLRTFRPMLRTALLCLIVAVVGLTALSEIGVNVAPLLAGAGIVGIAIGFGSQRLVQDLITGLFLLLENGVQVGDNVSVAGLSGTVENVSIRTIRLRAADGSVHIVPFSAVTTITNASRGAGNAAVSVSVAYKEDTDRASQILKDIVAEMRCEADYRQAIRGDLELWGVDKVDGSMATIVGQIRCTDSGRWPVQREFNRRMKRRFQECGIEIASTGQTILMQIPASPADVTSDAMPRRAAG
jgi:small-conductance mechanosensitive channel